MLNSKAAVSFIPDKNEKTKKSRSKKALFRSFVVESGRIAAAAAATASSFFFFLPASVRPWHRHYYCCCCCLITSFSLCINCHSWKLATPFPLFSLPFSQLEFMLGVRSERRQRLQRPRLVGTQPKSRRSAVLITQ